MKKMTRALLFIGLALAGLAMHPALAAEPSRAPDPGCQWETFASPTLGIRLLVENCSDPNMHYVFSAKDDWLEQHRPSDDRTFVSHQIVRVLSKPAGQPIEAAIRQQFVATLPDKAARASCRVAPARETGVSRPGKILLELVPSGTYARLIMRQLKKEPRDFGCGDYGKGQANRYFEYHPAQSTTTYLWIDAGQDEPLFDQNSIEITAKSAE
jgi:hypothetical protein